MSLSRFLRTLQLALKSVMLHKLRSGLTMLGIVFGVFSVIAMLAIGEGASSQAQKQVLELGATNIIVRSVKPPDETSSSSSGGGQSFVLRYGLTRKDLEVISETIPSVMGVVPVRELTQEVRHQQYTLNARVVGSTPEYLEMNHLGMEQGRFLTGHDLEEMANVVVLGALVAATDAFTPEFCEDTLRAIIKKKSLIDMNMEAFRRGYDYVRKS